MADPYGVEGEPQSVDGLGLLPVHTVLAKQKTTVRRRMRFLSEEGPICEGYEIHMGKTEMNGHALQSLAFPIYSGEKPDGYRISTRCWGTYLHGILDNRDVVEDILRRAGVPNVHLPNYRAFKERQYGRLADHLRQHLDISFIYKGLSRV